MANFYLSPISTILQAFTDQGIILAGGSLSTFLAGTSTPTSTYTDSTGLVQNAVSITLNAAGRLPNVMVWQKQNVAIKAIFKDSSGVQIGPTFDQIVGINDPTAIQLTFYGGTDTGAANAYVLTFSAGFSSYQNGTIIYWVPANTNTGTSTININGLGVVNLTNPDGTPLVAGQIIAGQPVTIVAQGGSFFLISVSQGNGSFTGTLTGMTGSVTATCVWVRINRLVMLTIPGAFTGTSNSTSLSMTGIPNAINPSLAQLVSIGGITDNSVTNLLGDVIVTTANQLNFELGVVSGTKVQAGGTSFTAANTKGVGQQITISYHI